MEPSTRVRRVPRRERWAWIIAAAAVVVLLALLPSILTHLRETLPEVHPMKFSILPPEKAGLGSFAVSPDGRWLAHRRNKGPFEHGSSPDGGAGASDNSVLCQLRAFGLAVCAVHGLLEHDFPGMEQRRWTGFGLASGAALTRRGNPGCRGN